MKAELHTLITDIKAAARIGHAESLWLALDGLFDLPEVAGNPPMKGAFIRKAILPIGKALVTPRVTAPMLRPLANHDHAALRAIAAVVTAQRYLDDPDVNLKDLDVHGQDPRKDVRQALVMGLIQAGDAQPNRLQALIQNWIQGDSPRLQAIAIQLLPTMAEQDPKGVISILSTFPPSGDPGVRTSLVDCLVELAQGEHPNEVLSLLKGLAEEKGNYLWVIGKTLSRSWIVPHTEHGLAIITHLAGQQGPEKILLKTLKAMERHGAEQAIAEAIDRWRKDSNPNLAALAEQMTERSE